MLAEPAETGVTVIVFPLPRSQLSIVTWFGLTVAFVGSDELTLTLSEASFFRLHPLSGSPAPVVART